MECSQPAAWRWKRSLLVASYVKAFSKRPKNPTRPCPELRTWREAVFSVTGVVSPALHLRLLLIRAGDIKLNPGSTCYGYSTSIRRDTTSIVCSTSQRHFHGTCSHLTGLQKGIQGFVCFSCSEGAAALPSMVTVTSNSVLPRRCLLCHTKI